MEHQDGPNTLLPAAAAAAADTTAAQQQQQLLKAKQGSSSAAVAQRRATSGGGHSSRRSQPGCPVVGHDAAVTPAVTPAGAAAAAAAAAFAHSTADQLGALVMDRQQQQQVPQQSTTVYNNPPQQQQQQPRGSVPMPLAPPSTPATATAAAAAAAPGDASMWDLEELFEEAEDAVDAFMRHPSNPAAAKLFGADISDALARLGSSSSGHNNALAAAAAAAGQTASPGQGKQKPGSTPGGLFSHLGLTASRLGLGAGFSKQQQQQQGPHSHPLSAGGGTAGGGAAGSGGGAGGGGAGSSSHHLTGAKRSKPSFTMSRDPAADRPHSRRELDNSSCGVAAAAAGGDAGAATEPASAAAASHCMRLAAAPTPPPSATCAAATEAAGSGFNSRRRWGLDLSDSGMASPPRSSPFAAAVQHSAAALTQGQAGGEGSNRRHHRASTQGLAVAKSGFKPPSSGNQGLKGSAARRCSCPGVYPPAGLDVSTAAPSGASAFPPFPEIGAGVASAATATAAPGGGATGGCKRPGRLSGAGPSSGLVVLDLSSPRSRGLVGNSARGDANMVTPFAQPSPGTGSSSALAAAAAAATGSMLAAAGAFNGPAAAAGGQGSRGAGASSSSLQSKRSVGGASAVSKNKVSAAPSHAPPSNTAPTDGCATAAVPGTNTAATTDSPPAVFVTITSASGMGPAQQSLSRRVSSRSFGSPGSADALAAAVAAARACSMDVDMPVDCDQLAAACAAAMAAVAADAAAAAGGSSSSSHRQQQQDGQDDSQWPKLPPIRTKSRTEGPVVVLNPAATGTSAMTESAAAASCQPPQAAPSMPSAMPATAGNVSSGSSREALAQQVLQQQMLLQKQGILPPNGLSAGAGWVPSNSMQQQQQAPVTPAVTPATAHAAQAAARAAGQPVSPGQVLAAAAANIAANCILQQAPTAGQTAARPSFGGTPNGIASSIAQMTLQSPAQMVLPEGPDNSSNTNSSGSGNDNSNGNSQPAAQHAWHARAEQQPAQQQQKPELPWQHLPANACNGVALVPGDSGLVLITGRMVTTGLIHASTPPKPASNMPGDYNGMNSSSAAAEHGLQQHHQHHHHGGLAGAGAGAGAADDGAAGPVLPPSSTPGLLAARPQSSAAGHVGTAAQFAPGLATAGFGAPTWNSCSPAAAGPVFGLGVAGAAAFPAGQQAAAARRMSAPQIYNGSMPIAPAAAPAFPGAAVFAAAQQPLATFNNMPGPEALWGSRAHTVSGSFPSAGATAAPVVFAADGSNGNAATACAGGGFALPGFGFDPACVDDELHSQQLQDLMQSSALMRNPPGDIFGSFVCE